MGSVVHFLCSEEMSTLFLDDPASFVRNGGSVGLADLAPDHPVWVKFAKAMVPFIRPTVACALAALCLPRAVLLPFPTRCAPRRRAATCCGDTSDYHRLP